MAPEPNPVLSPLVGRELLAQRGVLQNRIGPGQKRRPEEGDERGYQCLSEVLKGIIKGGKLMLERIYEVFADHRTSTGGRSSTSQLAEQVWSPERLAREATA